MKKIGIVGTKGYIEGSAFLPTDELLRRVGNNTGNLLFQYAVYNSIDDDKVVIGQDIPWDISIIKETCRIIVIPAANFIRENFDMTGFVDFLEKVDLPLIFLGLGAQATDYSQENLNFHPSIIKLISLAKERCLTVGVRGEFTEKILNKSGVSNVKIIGCPTNFINKDPDFGLNLDNKWNSPINSFMATADEPWPKDSTKVKAERLLFDWAYSNAGIYIQQSVAPLIKYSRKSNWHQTEAVDPKHEDSLRTALRPGMCINEFKKFMSTRFRVYFNVDQWLEDAAKVDFSIGLRMHGNMAAWQSGTPAIWIYHDSRTQELAETMALPSISHKRFIEVQTIQELRDLVGFDHVYYTDRRFELKNNYESILRENNIK